MSLKQKQPPEQSSPDRDQVEVLAEEFLERYRRGERPALSEYTDRNPDLADEIRDLFPALVMMEDVRPAPDDAPRMPPSEQLSLTQLGDFRIIREVGRGGMGLVYEAEQVSLGRRVALKVLPRQALLDSRHKQRFLREAKAAARLHHTNIVPVFGVGEQDGLHYYVMQFIHGLGLDEVLIELRRLRDENQASGGHKPTGSAPVAVQAAAVAQSMVTGHFDRTLLVDSDADQSDGPPEPLTTHQSPLTPSDTAVGQLSDTLHGSGAFPLQSTIHSRHVYWQSVARIGLQAAQALQYAHDQGVIHRDVKPGNLLLDTRGSVWVTDFGLAKAADQQDLTHTGDVLGTLRYMAPEQFDGKADARSDVFSLGLTLYELLALKPAFDETERHRLVKQVTTGAPPRLRTLDSSIPRDLETIVHKAIDRDPSHRYQTAEELAADLQRYLGDEPIRARWISPVTRIARWCRRNREIAGLTSTIVVLLAVVAFVALSSIRDRQQRQRNLFQQTEQALHRADELQRQDDWEAARAAVEQARAFIDRNSGPAELRAQVDDRLADIDVATRIEEIRRAWGSAYAPDFRVGEDAPPVQRFSNEEADTAYAEAFGGYGLAVDALGPPELVGRIRSSSVREELVIALDHWTLVRRAQADTSGSDRLTELASAADDDEWRRQLREVDPESDASILQTLADTIPIDKVPPSTIVRLAELLYSAGLKERAVEILRQGHTRHPDDFWINARLGYYCRFIKRQDDAVRFLTAAIALRPNSPSEYASLGSALAHSPSRIDEAISACRKAVSLDPASAYAHHCLGAVLRDKAVRPMYRGYYDEAVRAYRKAIELDPARTAVLGDLGYALLRQDRHAEAEPLFRTLVERRIGDLWSYWRLGQVLYHLNRNDEARDVLEHGLRLYPDDPMYEWTCGTLANVLIEAGAVEEAGSALQEAVGDHPESAILHFRLGQHYFDQTGQFDLAELEFTQMLRLLDMPFSEVPPPPHDSFWQVCEAHWRLGRIYRQSGRLAEAIRQFRVAVWMWPSHIVIRQQFIETMNEAGRAAEADAELEAVFAEAMRAAEASGDSTVTVHVCRAGALAQLDRTEEALAEFDRAAAELTARGRQAANLDERSLPNTASFIAASLNRQGKRISIIDLLQNSNVTFWRALVNALSKALRWQDAAACCEKLQELTGDELTVSDRLQWALSLTHLNQLDKALQQYEEATLELKSRPANATDGERNRLRTTAVTIARELERQGRHEHIVDVLQTAIHSAPDFDALHDVYQGELRSLDRLPDAITFYKAQIAELPSVNDELPEGDLAVLYRNLAEMLRVSGDDQNRLEAVEFAQLGVALRPHDALFWRTLSRSQYDLHHWKDAAVTYAKLSELPGEELTVIELLKWAIALAHLQQHDSAREHYEQARELLENRSEPPTALELARQREAESLLGIELEAGVG